ncbi:MAG: hypothetical protein [Bacteriophage sp.]|nr:MAG: hypothetical protein [Bacteriophage sp.]
MSMTKVYNNDITTTDGVKREVKVHKDTTTGEYRARLYIDGKARVASDAFDDDKDSIIGTAEAILRHELPGLPVAATPAPFHGSTSRNFREGTYANRLARKRDNMQKLKEGTRLNVTPPNEQRVPKEVKIGAPDWSQILGK